MKKIALLLVTCMTVATIAVACGSNDEKETTTKKTTTTTEKETTTEAETTTEEATTATPTYTDNGDGSETLYSSAWWSGGGVSKDYALSGDGSVKIKIVTAADTAAFSVELYNAGTDAAADGYYVTTGSDGNAWVAELLTGTVTCPFAETGADPGKFVAGNTYEVTVTRAGNDYTVVYYDVTAGAEMYTMTVAADVEAPADLNVHVMAQVGTVTVSAAE